jgi:hypothetical protein
MVVQGALKRDREPRPPVRTRTTLTLDEVLVMERAELLRLWRQVFGSDPPRNTGARFLARALGHALQVREQGDVPARVLRGLRTVAEGKVPPAGSGAALRPGVCLMREWNGRTYRVEVVAEGFLMDGRHYRSLSAIARQITGARWSGPRFFGIG